MFVEPCPKCGRQPIIDDYCSHNGIRRRGCICPRYCSVVPGYDHLNSCGFVFLGDGDDNDIFKRWNKAIAQFKSNQNKRWFEEEYDWFENDNSVERRSW